MPPGLINGLMHASARRKITAWTPQTIQLGRGLGCWRERRSRCGSVGSVHDRLPQACASLPAANGEGFTGQNLVTQLH